MGLFFYQEEQEQEQEQERGTESLSDAAVQKRT
jgi:hypothetical protein